jgi:serine/threonine protein kinase
LEYLHNRRVLHLDIKPDNVMVTNLNVIKIVDFGSAQNFNPLSLKQYSRGLGTLEYMCELVTLLNFPLVSGTGTRQVHLG